eukprot:3738234-Pyramimonas_sp.AAC.1
MQGARALSCTPRLLHVSRVRRARPQIASTVALELEDRLGARNWCSDLKYVPALRARIFSTAPARSSATRQRKCVAF